MSKKNPKKSPMIVFIGAFIVIIILMIIANLSKDVEVALEMPFNEGVRSLSAYDNKLLAVASDDKTFLWDWDELGQDAVIGKAAFEQALLLDADSVISIKQGQPAVVVVSSVRGGEVEKEILLDSGTDLGVISTNCDCSVLVAILAVSSDSKDRTEYKFYNIDLDGQEASRINQVSDDSSLIQLTDFAVSDEGKFITGAGEKNHKARLLVIDIKGERVLWDKTYDVLKSFTSVIFSLDGKNIFAGGSDGALYKINANTGEIINKAQIKEQIETAHKAVPIQNLAISPNGKLIAVGTTSGFRVLDCEFNNEVFSEIGIHKLSGPLVFSPDSSFIATSDLRQGMKIKIWSIPGH